MDINMLTISGRLTADPIIEKGKVEWSRFSIAVGSSKKVDGQWVNETDFFNCVAFGKNTKEIGIARKGDGVVVVGRLKQNNYVNKDGQKVQSVQVIVDSVHLLKNKIVEKEHQLNYEPPQSWPSDQEVPF